MVCHREGLNHAVIRDGQGVHAPGLGTGDGREKIVVVAQVLFVADQADERVLPLVFPDNPAGLVGRTVILDEDFADGAGLPEDGVELRGEILRSVVGTHHDADLLHKAVITACKVSLFS